MDRNVPVREQAIIYLVNQLRDAFEEFVDAFDENERQQAVKAFNLASEQLAYFGIRRDSKGP